MKKLLLISIMFLFAFTANVFAQEVNVTAEVLADITLNSTAVSFGNVQQGNSATIAANGDDNGGVNSNTSDPVAGSLIVTADAQDYTVEVSQDAVLSDGGSDPENTLTFTHTVFLGADNVTTAVDGAGYTVEGGGNETFDIGGTLQSPSAAGSYTTASGSSALPLQFTVSYVAF